MPIPKIDQNDPLYIGQSMRIALLGNRKYGFVTGACTRALYKDELHEQWETCNAIVLSWIMNTVSEDLLSGIVYATNAFSVWADLKERFDKVNRMRIYQLHREITTLTQGTDSISLYFTKLKTLWNEYDAVVPSPGCTCPQSKDYVNHIQQLRLIQFLSGLNESYDQARRQILLKGATPTINQAYAMIIEDEIQHSNYVANENCYKLIGYPDDWKNRRKSNNLRNASGASYSGDGGKQFLANNVKNSAGSSHYAGQHSSNHAAGIFHSQEASTSFDEDKTLHKGHAFTDQEYKQIMEMLNKDVKEPKQVNMAGIATTCLMSTGFTQNWIVDSGASHHITANKHLLTKSYSIDKTQQNQVHLPTGDKVDISHVGEDLYSGKVKGIDKEEGGLYVFKGDTTITELFTSSTGSPLFQAVTHPDHDDATENIDVEANGDVTDNAEATEIICNDDSQFSTNSSADIRPDISSSPPVMHTPMEPSIRKTSRPTKAPTWLQDYVTTGRKQSSTRHPLANFLSYEKLTSCYRSYLCKVSDYMEPKNFKQAAKDDRWILAMQQEIQALEDNKT
ncbi:hypothetical protein KY289_006847 [Solanum tuberosum]|nr:hypothetical protein KY289_006847 [Solanum tuberosum]